MDDHDRTPVMSDRRIHHVLYIASTAERVWNALTDPDMTQRYWFGTRMRSDWKVGSRLDYVVDGKVNDAHTILEIEPPHRLVHSFHPVFGEYEREAPSRVSYTLDECNGVVRLTLLHDRF